MALKKLPHEVQSLFYATTQMKSFKTVVEELVYNSLDAEATSIAVRVHIQDNSLQVVDNGYGVAEEDFKLFGQRHATSKFRAGVPQTINRRYGCSGQSLANIIKVSQNVTITSRFNDAKETWMKQFVDGKEQNICITGSRPSMGTTVDIKGFLYNLQIHKKSINPLQELQNIKLFLEQIALVHVNTSISLRDDSENEIIFKIHKNRDIYQTLFTLFNIEKMNMQELQVEKNQYKVICYISKNNIEIQSYHWMYLNGRFIYKSRLHKIVNENLMKSASSMKISKTKYNYDEHKLMSKKNLPDYFIFIKCPLNDYNIISTSKHFTPEFENWDNIQKLLEKLVMLYTGDQNATKKIASKVETIPITNDTRNQVKQIMEKILGSHSKNIGVSQMQKGIKGKLVKRKTNKPPSHTSISKIRSIKKHSSKTAFTKILEKKSGFPNKKDSKNNETSSLTVPKMNKLKSNILALDKTKPKEINKNKPDAIISKFDKQTDTVQNRCNLLAKKVDVLLQFKKKRHCKVFTNEIVECSDIVKDNRTVSIRKKIDEIIIHEYLPLPTKNDKKLRNYDDASNDIKTSDDLMLPVINIVGKNVDSDKLYKNKNVNYVQGTKRYNMHSDYNYSSDCSPQASHIPRLTYESHKYNDCFCCTKENYEKHNPVQFISKTSRDNFLSPQNRRGITKANPKKIKQRQFYGNCRRILNNQKEMIHSLSYSIDFSERKTNENSSIGNNNGLTTINTSNYWPNVDNTHIGGTYTIQNSENFQNTYIVPDRDEYNFGTYCIEASSYIEEVAKNRPSLCTNEINTKSNDLSIIFFSNSQVTRDKDIEPLNVCETVLESVDKENSELQFIFGTLNKFTCEQNDQRNDDNKQFDSDELINGYDQFSQDFTVHQKEPNVIDNVNLITLNDSKKHNFNLKNRKRYIPKGMSPIFENCNSKNICDYELNEDYFENAMYNKFAAHIQLNSEIFKPIVQNVKELTTKELQKVNNKLKKDNACLTFDGKSLNHAKILGQVDGKFIATKIKDSSYGANSYLVLFDQHAVHERIRLERNLSVYVKDEEWKRVKLDNITLKLSKDEILYLHNYKDKFMKLGLAWNIINDNEISLNAIPEAILGKNPRQVDVVLKAVKSLIKEEINMVKEQGGCVSLYPKSIMDLVFSEACRYAIMFGDVLSKNDCVDLIKSLSECKTPFQCAHGRPVMAVLTDIKTEKRIYKVNLMKVRQFKQKTMGNLF